MIRLLELRLVVESEMVAMRRSVDDVHDMRAGLAAILRVSDDPMAASEADSQFYLAIARVLKSDYLTRFWKFLGVRQVPPGHWRRAANRTSPQDYARRVNDRISRSSMRSPGLTRKAPRIAARRHVQHSFAAYPAVRSAVG